MNLRYIPTSLYIDTQVFVQQGHRFDTQVFTDLLDTFVKGGIRLLIPEMMERELLRKFDEQSIKATQALIKAHKTHPIASLSLIELFTEEELQAKCYDEMVCQWEKFKEHFIVEKLPLVGDLDNVVDWYFKKEPPFSKKPKEFPDAFILSALEHYHKERKSNIAVVSGDNDFSQACTLRRFIAHFPSLDEYIKAFEPELKSEDLERPVIDPTRPITTEDLTELQAILRRSNEVTPFEVERALRLIEPKGPNYDYFFDHAKDGVWLEPLRSNGYFDNPPDEKPDGDDWAPFWPPLNYLVRVYETMPEMVLEILENLPETSNTHILEGIMDVVLKTDSVEVVNRLSSRILSFLEHAREEHDDIIKLLKKPFLFDRELVEFTPAFLTKLVGFLPDPKAEEKQARRLEILDKTTSPEPMSGYAERLATYLEPLPRFDEWEYQQIFEKGIRPLCEKEPYQIARILIDATATMIRLSKHQEELEKEGDEDYSNSWLKRLNQSVQNYRDSQGTLVHTLVFSCEKVYEKSPESIEGLDQALRNQRWKVFKRLRQHLYALNPSEQTFPWIREFVLTHKDYAKWEHHYEFQLMIRTACEHFGARLLNDEERTEIFEAILSGGPRKDSFDWTGEPLTEEEFQQLQRDFRRKQLRPFKRLLTGEYQIYFQELEEAAEKPLSDEDYSPISQGGMVSYCSPKSPEELAGLGDERLLAYINEWQEKHRDEDNWLVEFNIEELSKAFNKVFKDTIIPDERRLTFWMENRDRIERPVYVKAIVQAIQEHVKELHYERLDLWFGFCEWVLSQSNVGREEDVQPRDASQKHPDWGISWPDESREHPNWESSRRAVGDFIGVCLEEDVNIPFTKRKSLANILRLLCTQFDRQLDRDDLGFLNRNDQMSNAINNTRSRALEDLAQFGFWVRRHDEQDNVPEVTSILEARFKTDLEYPLTMPEYAMLGRCYGQFWSLNQTWAFKHKAVFFPQGDLPSWIEAFRGFLLFTRPFKPTFDILRDDFAFALDHLADLEGKKYSIKEPINTLGQHLFTYYLAKVYPLNGEDSLLEKFYEKTIDDKQQWARLFTHIGWSMGYIRDNLEQDLIDRIIAFFDWRLAQKVPEELQKIALWLEAEYFDPDWRLDAYAKILDVRLPDDMGRSSVLTVLNGMLESHTEKVVACFAKMTDYIDQNNSFYIDADEAKLILKAGLENEDESIRENAERAQENLLRAGRHSFLDI